MPNFRAPGVFIQEVTSEPRVIALRTATATAFVGPVVSGPSDRLVALHSFAAYVAQYGPIGGPEDHMGLALHTYFANGGDDARIVPVATALAHARDYTLALRNLAEADPRIGLLVMPGQTWGQDVVHNDVIRAVVAFCEVTRQSMALIDLAPDIHLSDAGSVRGLGLPDSEFAALYYPHVELSHPITGDTIIVPASPMVAAVFARISRSRGVWKAPAGKDAQLTLVERMAISLTDQQRSILSPLGVNTLRELPSGISVWGARTLSSDPQWRYVTLRRVASLIENSLSDGLTWVRMESNNETLWQQVKASAHEFMNTLFRSGAFQGSSANDAFFVRCGLHETMTDADVIAGRLVLHIGYAPLKPAEFSILELRLNTRNS